MLLNEHRNIQTKGIVLLRGQNDTLRDGLFKEQLGVFGSLEIGKHFQIFMSIGDIRALCAEILPFTNESEHLHFLPSHRGDDI